MFDQKSRSSLEKVSIQEQLSKTEDLLHLIQVLNQSKKTLKEVELKIRNPYKISEQVIELLTTGSGLRSLIVWDWGSHFDRNKFPLSRLAPSTKAQTSSVGQFQLFWGEDGARKVDSKHLNSLISFAQGATMEPQDCRELVSNFSQTVVHLRLGVDNQSSMIKPLFCPNLKIFEGWVWNGVSSFFDAPQLQILIVEDVTEVDLNGLLPSVEEVWLRNRIDRLEHSKDWEPLLRLCPKLRILKLTEDFWSENLAVDSFVFTGVLEMLEIRYLMARDGEEIDGIKMVSLEKLILPTSLLTEKELKRAAKVAGEVIDVKDYKEFIDIEY